MKIYKNNLNAKIKLKIANKTQLAITVAGISRFRLKCSIL